MRGFTEAAERFGQHVATPTTLDDAYVPLFEALNWAVSIDVRLGYPANADVRGIRFVRNSVHHDWATAIQFAPSVGYGEGPYGLGPYGGDPARWLWRPLTDLPPSGRNLTPHETANRDSYDSILAGTSVASALERLSIFFRTQS